MTQEHCITGFVHSHALNALSSLDTPHEPVVRVSSRSARAAQVEALTLTRADGRYEAACNLLRPKETTPSMVLDAAKEKATALGIQIVDDYETGLTEEQAIAAIFHV